MLDLGDVNPFAISWNSCLLRSFSGFTQAGLSDATGVGLSSIVRVENRQCKYSKPYAMAIAWACYLKISDDEDKVEKFTTLVKEPVYLADKWVVEETSELSPAEIFGANLRKIRCRFALSQSFLGDLSGYVSSYISAVEVGRFPMTEMLMETLDNIFLMLAKDDPDLMSWYDKAKRGIVLGEDPPRYFHISKGWEL